MCSVMFIKSNMCSLVWGFFVASKQVTKECFFLSLKYWLQMTQKNTKTKVEPDIAALFFSPPLQTLPSSLLRSLKRRLALTSFCVTQIRFQSALFLVRCAPSASVVTKSANRMSLHLVWDVRVITNVRDGSVLQGEAIGPFQAPTCRLTGVDTFENFFSPRWRGIALTFSFVISPKLWVNVWSEC